MREFLNQTESIRESLKQTRTRFQELIQVGTGYEEEPVFDTHPYWAAVLSVSDQTYISKY